METCENNDDVILYDVQHDVWEPAYHRATHFPIYHLEGSWMLGHATQAIIDGLNKQFAESRRLHVIPTRCFLDVRQRLFAETH